MTRVMMVVAFCLVFWMSSEAQAQCAGGICAPGVFAAPHRVAIWVQGPVFQAGNGLLATAADNASSRRANRQARRQARRGG